jgi:hypothetical protein
MKSVARFGLAGIRSVRVRFRYLLLTTDLLPYYELTATPSPQTTLFARTRLRFRPPLLTTNVLLAVRPRKAYLLPLSLPTTHYSLSTLLLVTCNDTATADSFRASQISLSLSLLTTNLLPYYSPTTTAPLQMIRFATTCFHFRLPLLTTNVLLCTLGVLASAFASDY